MDANVYSSVIHNGQTTKEASVHQVMNSKQGNVYAKGSYSADKEHMIT